MRTLRPSIKDFVNIITEEHLNLCTRKRLLMILHVNNSLIKEYINCPRKAYFSYIHPSSVDGASLPSNLGALIGSCIHECLEVFFTGGDLQSSLSTLHSKYKLPEEGRGCLPHIESVLSQYLASSKDFFSQYEPFASELTLEKPMTDNLTFRGTVDMILEHKETKELFVLDFKTGSDPYRYTLKSLPFAQQFVGYYALVSHCFPDRVVNNKFLVHAIPTALTKSKSGAKSPYFWDVTITDHALEEWQEYVLYYGYLIHNMIEDGLIPVGNKGEACVAYNTRCAFAEYCLGNSKKLIPVESDYQGFRVSGLDESEA